MGSTIDDIKPKIKINGKNPLLEVIRSKMGVVGLSSSMIILQFFIQNMSFSDR
jgi:hypothetical protein